MPWFIPSQSARQPSLIFAEGRYENEYEAWKAYEKLQADDLREEHRYGIPYEANDYAHAQEKAIAVMTLKNRNMFLDNQQNQKRNRL